MSAAVFCIAINEAQATVVLDELKLTGVTPREISVLLPDVGAQRDAQARPTDEENAAAPPGVGGGILGGAISWLAGAGGIALPGLGPFIAAGPVMERLAPAPGDAPANSGRHERNGDGLRKVLIELGLPDYEARIYIGRLREGGVLIAVHAEDERRRETARSIFEREGAEDIGIAGEVAVGGGGETNRM